MENDTTPAGAFWPERGKQMLVALVTVAAGYFIGNGAMAYTRDAAVFNLERIEVRGNIILTRAELVEALDLDLTTSLFDLPMRALQRRVEAVGYVYGVRIGRTFPHTLFVDVVENRPLAYVAGPDEYYVLTAEGVALPLPHGRMELELPTIAGIDSAGSALEAGHVGGHSQLGNIHQVLRYMESSHPRLFAELSELVLSENGEVTLYFAETSTAVKLSGTGMRQSIALLDAFLTTIRGKKNLRDYAYIDLRYKRQIVVKERA